MKISEEKLSLIIIAIIIIVGFIAMGAEDKTKSDSKQQYLQFKLDSMQKVIEIEKLKMESK